MVHAVAMKRKHRPRRTGRKVTRVSVTVPQKHYTELSRIAEKKRVSVAWVVRAAVEQYLTASTPLFPPTT